MVYEPDTVFTQHLGLHGRGQGTQRLAICDASAFVVVLEGAAVHGHAVPLAQQLDSLRQTQSGLVNERQAVAGPGHLILGKFAADHWFPAERKLSTALQVPHTDRLHGGIAEKKCLGDLAVRLAHRIQAAEVTEPAQDDLPLFAPSQLVTLATAPFLQLQSQPEADILVDRGTVAPVDPQAQRAVHLVATSRTGAVYVGAVAWTRLGTAVQRAYTACPHYLVWWITGLCPVDGVHRANEAQRLQSRHVFFQGLHFGEQCQRPLFLVPGEHVSVKLINYNIS